MCRSAWTRTHRLIHARTLSAAVVLLAATIAAASARDLTVVSRGEALNDATRKVFAIPFAAATAIPAQTESWDGGLDTLHGQAKGADSVWDIVQLDAEELATGCSDGLFEKLDWSAIGGKDHYMPQAVSDCGVGAVGRQHWCWPGTATSFRPRRPGPTSGTWRNIPASAGLSQSRARQPGNRADGRRRGAWRRLQDAGHQRRRGPRVPQAGPAQALYRVVADRRRGGAYPGLRRRVDDQRRQPAGSRSPTGAIIAISASSGCRQPVRVAELGDRAKGSPDLQPGAAIPVFRRQRRRWRRGCSPAPALVAWPKARTTCWRRMLLRCRPPTRPTWAPACASIPGSGMTTWPS